MVLPYSLIIIIDILSQPWPLLASKFFIRKSSSLLIRKEFNRVSVLYFSVGNMLEF